jgi:hypothetical protein
MAWYDGILDKISGYAREKLRQFESLFAKGLGPQQANHIVKEESALKEENRKGVQPWEALSLWREFNSGRTTSLESLPSGRSQWLRQSMAQPTHFRSGFDYRYLLDFEYQVRDSVTGEITTVANTLGFRRLERWGRITDRITDRIDKLKEASEEFENIYSVAGKTYVEDSVVIKGFYRTVAN